MADYKALRGFTITEVAGNPGNPQEGQIWYNTTTKELKAHVAGQAAWSSGGNMTRINEAMGAAGVTNAALAVGGQGSPGSGVEEYNGSAWTAVTALPRSASHLGMAGIQTAALSFGGTPPPTAVETSEEYDGTNWTAGGNMISGEGGDRLKGFGTQTAAVKSGGNPTSQPPYKTDDVQHYNGTSWSTATALPEVNKDHAAAGTQTAGLVMCGDIDANTTCHVYDGTAWGFAANTSVGRAGGHTGFGAQNAAVVQGGSQPQYQSTEEFDGTAWTSAPNRNTQQTFGGGAGATTSGICFGGESPGGRINTTEEYTASGTATEVISIIE